MHISEQTRIGDLVAFNYLTAQVFKKNGIDFCCNGDRSIEEACKEKKIDTSNLVRSLQQSVQQKDSSPLNFNTWPADLLADYIERIHHRFVREKIEEIHPLLTKLVKVHGKAHPELEEVNTLFSESASELTAHLKKEELVLFPYVRQMATGNSVNNLGKFASIENPIKMMMHDHDGEGERFRKIAALTHNYTVPADACNTYKIAFALLKDIEEDLHLHIHLENNILFPKAVTLEKQLANQY